MRQNITVQKNDAGQRLDKFLCKLMPGMPKGMLYKLIRKKDIRLNGARCKGMEILSDGDVLTLYVKEEFLEKPAKPAGFQKASGILQVVYETDSLLVVYKPKGMFCHSGNDGTAVTLLDEVQQYLFRKGEYLPDREQSFAPALCNRIDRNTEGLVIAAKTAEMLREMNEAIRQHRVHKAYLAVTAAPLPNEADLCYAWLKKDSRSNMVRISEKQPDASWLDICTEYRVLAQNGRQQLVYVELHTGRTHQIRAHLAHLHAPILGDPKYGNGSGAEENQCLCAYALRFSDVHGVEDGQVVFGKIPEFLNRFFPEITESSIRAGICGQMLNNKNC